MVIATSKREKHCHLSCNFRDQPARETFVVPVSLAHTHTHIHTQIVEIVSSRQLEKLQLRSLAVQRDSFLFRFRFGVFLFIPVPTGEISPVGTPVVRRTDEETIALEPVTGGEEVEGRGGAGFAPRCLVSAQQRHRVDSQVGRVAAGLSLPHSLRVFIANRVVDRRDRPSIPRLDLEISIPCRLLKDRYAPRSVIIRFTWPHKSFDDPRPSFVVRK